MIVFLCIAAVLLIGSITAYVYIRDHYTITTVYVEGNEHYTDDEIIEKVMVGSLGHNSLYLNFKYRNQAIENIPFVAALEVDIITPDTVKITVYEKSLAGYVSYLGRYMYFDKDGTVVESAHVKTVGIPEVIGLSFDHVVMYEKLPIDNLEIFEEILDITQSLDKYQLKADKLYFDRNYRVTLVFDQVRVEIGDNDHIDEKFSRLQGILPNLTGKSGILQMSNYGEDIKSFTFESDRTEIGLDS